MGDQVVDKDVLDFLFGMFKIKSQIHNENDDVPLEDNVESNA